MALKVQYNKTYMQLLRKGLKVRENALPTLQAKESALRVEVKKAREEAVRYEEQFRERERASESSHRLWTEFPQGLVKVERVDIEVKKIAGVKAPVLNAVRIGVAPHSLVSSAPWVESGIAILGELVELRVRKEIALEKVQILERARRKTTQKVNLYEKVQIPEYREAILKIKRFLEDEENLAKAAQKTLKVRIAAAELEEQAA